MLVNRAKCGVSISMQPRVYYCSYIIYVETHNYIFCTRHHLFISRSVYMRAFDAPNFETAMLANRAKCKLLVAEMRNGNARQHCQLTALYVYMQAFEPEMRHSAVKYNHAKCELSKQKFETEMLGNRAV